MSMYHMCVLCLLKPEEGTGAPRCYRQLCIAVWMMGIDLGPLEELLVLLTAEPASWPNTDKTLFNIFSDYEHFQTDKNTKLINIVIHY